MSESKEFTEWWNAKFDPDETGRTRMAASHAFEAGRYYAAEVVESLSSDIQLEMADANDIAAKIVGLTPDEYYDRRQERLAKA